MEAVRSLRRLPWGLILPAAGLAGLGLAGIMRADELDLGPAGLAQRQLVWLAVTTICSAGAGAIGHRRLRHHAYGLLAVSLVLLVAVYFFPPINGARRWIRLGAISLQPSELAKLAYLIALARWLADGLSDGLGCRQWRSLLGLLGLTLVPVVLVLKEPDLGTSLVFVPVFLAMVFLAGARRRDLALLVCAGLALAPLLWTQMSREQQSRVTALFEQPIPGQRPSDDAYHLFQARQIMALGGVWGSAVAGEPTPDRGAYALPAAGTDFVFCLLGERLGWLGCGGLLALYALLVWRLLAAGLATRDPFGRLLASGVGVLLAVEVVINTAMTVGLAPITGLPLPLVSYGGSGLLAHGLALGMAASVAMRPGIPVESEPFRYFRRRDVGGRLPAFR